MPKNVKKQPSLTEDHTDGAEVKAGSSGKRGAEATAAGAGSEKALGSSGKTKGADKITATEARKRRAEAKPKKPRAPKVKNWTATAAYRKQRETLEDAVLKAKGDLTAIDCDRIDEYMDFWAQRKLLGDDVRKRGPTVLDERGRQSENRSISLALQVSKQMLELYKAMGLAEEPERAGGSSRRGRGADAADDEDDEL